MTALTAPPPLFAYPAQRRSPWVAGGVVAFHLALLWAVHSGLVRRAADVIVPPAVLKVFVELPAPEVAPPPPPVVVKKVEPARPHDPAPAPQQVQAPQPQVEAVALTTAPTGTFSAPPAAAPAPAPAPVAPPAPRMELPSGDAAYLQNPKPVYPAVSRRLNEKGKVIVRVLIGVDGTAQKAELYQSSGFQRLDDAAISTVTKWRYVPGKRDGVPEAMWFNVPIDFVLG